MGNEPSETTETSRHNTGADDIGPRDVFLQLLTIVTLYLSAVAFGTILFQFINLGFPDTLESIYSLDSQRSSLRWGVAALIVVFPIYAWVSWYIGKGIRILPERSELKSRKWLLNLTLFSTAIVIIIDLISLVLHYLEGDLSVRFVLKVLVVLSIATAIFVYYLWNLRTKGQGSDKRIKMFVYAVVGVVAISLITGFLVAGSPKSERLRRIDERRVSDLVEIQWQIVNFWQTKEQLPVSLEDVVDPLRGYDVPTDPETGAAYEYQILDTLTFELCATFIQESSDSAPRIVLSREPFQKANDTWTHGAGRTCFERTIDPDRYGDDERPIPIPGRF